MVQVGLGVGTWGYWVNAWSMVVSECVWMHVNVSRSG